MRKASALLVVLVVAFLFAIPSALAQFTSPLPGHVFYVNHDVSNGKATLHVFTQNGTHCGSVIINGVGTSNNATLALQMNMDVMIQESPNRPTHFGVWWIDTPMQQTMCVGASGALRAYHITIF